jgi:hypothetical protein
MRFGNCLLSSTFCGPFAVLHHFSVSLQYDRFELTNDMPRQLNCELCWLQFLLCIVDSVGELEASDVFGPNSLEATEAVLLGSIPATLIGCMVQMDTMQASQHISPINCVSS